jgi:hypothetical protein
MCLQAEGALKEQPEHTLLVARPPGPGRSSGRRVIFCLYYHFAPHTIAGTRRAGNLMHDAD